MIQNKAPFENEYVKYWIKDGVLHTEFAENLDVDLELAKLLTELRIDYVEGVNYPSMADIRNLRKVDYNAMRFWASNRAYVGTTKVAIYSSSLSKKFVFNIWSIFDKPVKPTKYFTDLGAAYLYLKDISAN